MERSDITFALAYGLARTAVMIGEHIWQKIVDMIADIVPRALARNEALPKKSNLTKTAK